MYKLCERSNSFPDHSFRRICLLDVHRSRYAKLPPYLSSGKGSETEGYIMGFMWGELNK